MTEAITLEQAFSEVQKALDECGRIGTLHNWCPCEDFHPISKCDHVKIVQEYSFVYDTELICKGPDGLEHYARRLNRLEFDAMMTNREIEIEARYCRGRSDRQVEVVDTIKIEEDYNPHTDTTVLIVSGDPGYESDEISGKLNWEDFEEATYNFAQKYQEDKLV